MGKLNSSVTSQNYVKKAFASKKKTGHPLARCFFFITLIPEVRSSQKSLQKLVNLPSRGKLINDFTYYVIKDLIQEMCCFCCCDCVLVLLAIIFPPLPVWIKRGLCSTDSLINIILTLLGYLPGLIHSFYIIAKYPDLEGGVVIIDEESGRVVTRGRDGVRVVRLQHHHHQHNHFENNQANNNRNYGSTDPPAYAELDRDRC